MTGEKSNKKLISIQHNPTLSYQKTLPDKKKEKISSQDLSRFRFFVIYAIIKANAETVLSKICVYYFDIKLTFSFWWQELIGHQNGIKISVMKKQVTKYN